LPVKRQKVGKFGEMKYDHRRNGKNNFMLIFTTGVLVGIIIGALIVYILYLIAENKFKKYK